MKTLRTPILVGATTWMFCMLALVRTTVAQTTVTRIPTLGGSELRVQDINRFGVLAGFSRTALEEQHACIYSNGVLRDLQTLGGPGSSAMALNDSGEVAGDSYTANGAYHAFLFRNGMMTDLGTLEGGSFSFAIAINNAGHVLGQSDAGDGSRGFLYRDGTLTDIGSLGSGFSSAYGLNSQGDVVGDSYTDTFEGPRAFVSRGGSVTDLGTLGGTLSRAWAINDAGVIVGESHDADGALRAFRYSNDTMENLGTLGGMESWAQMINNAGDILGDSHTADNQYRSFIFRNGTMTDLGTLGGRWNTAYDLNNLGHVVGESETATGTTRPFIWRNGVMTDLNTFLPPDSGWLLASAFHINDADQIVGFGFYNGEFVWYLLTLDNPNQSPVANAGADQTVECSAMTLLDGSASTDPDGDPLSFEWREGTVVLGYGATLSVNLGLGTHTLTLTVRDSNEVSSDDTLTVVVQDTIAPNVACEQARTVAAGTDCQAPVPDFATGAIATDGCTSSSGLIKSQLPLAGAMVGLGTHQVVVSVQDASGNVGTCTVLLTVADVTPPTGECAPAMTVSAREACLGVVPDFTAALMATDNCTAAAQLVKTQTPPAGTLVPLGSHDITLTVADAAGNKSMCVTRLHVVDTMAPVVNCPAGVTAEAGAEGQAAVPDFTAGTTAFDNCGGNLVITQAPAAGTMLGFGTHNVTVTATDAAGNRGSCTTTFTVVDRTPPVFLALSVDPNVLNTANRAMVPVTVSVSVTDNFDSAPVARILSISSDEPVTGHSDNTSPDWVITGDLTGEVRAECTKKGDGRIYTITVICTDASGNSSTATTTVFVPSKNDGGPSRRLQ
jgi:probable HAF family extracellular repeat protein